MLEKLKEAYHFIFEDELLNEIHKSGQLKEFKAGEIIIDFGDYVNDLWHQKIEFFCTRI